MINAKAEKVLHVITSEETRNAVDLLKVERVNRETQTLFRTVEKISYQKTLPF